MLLVVSVDVEEDNWEPARTGITVENSRELPRMVTFLKRLGIRPTLFATYQVLREPWAGGVLRELAGDVEVGTHLHPWNTPPVLEPLSERYTMLSNLPAALQRAKLERLTAAYRSLFGWSPASFRAGRFALSTEVVGSLADFGYRVDSSVTPFISWTELKGPNFIGAPLAAYRLSPGADPRKHCEAGPVIELPLSAGFTRFMPSAWTGVDRALRTGLGRWLRIGSWAARSRLMRRIVLSPETSSVRDMLGLSRSLLEGGAAYLHMFLHSPSLFPGLTPYTPSKRAVDGLYDAVEQYLEGLTALTGIRSLTVGVAAPELAPPARATVAQEQPRTRATPQRVTTGTRRRLLVVTYHFPPDGAVGGLRWNSLAKYLQRDGWEVSVLTAAEGAGRGDGEGPAVHRCPRARTLLHFYRDLALAPGRQGNGTAVTRSWWRSELVAALSLPDESRGWVLRAARRARALIRSLRPDIVVSSGPPHSAHLVARMATAGSGVRWIVDLRDPWPHMVSQVEQWDPIHGTAAARAFMPRLERTVMAGAHGVLANTELLASRLATRYPTTPVVWVRNGFDPERIPPHAPAPHDGLQISYVGTLYGKRSLQATLEALRLYIARHSLPPGGVVLQVAGATEEPYRGELKHAVAALRLEDYVRLRGLLPEDQALGLLRQSDLAIVLAQGQHLQVPAKLYECLGLGLPTLVLADAGSAAAREAAALGAWVVEPEDASAIADVFGRVHHNAKAIRPKPSDEILYPGIARRLSGLLADPGGFLLQAWSEARHLRCIPS